MATKAVATPPGQPTQNVTLTSAEQTARDADEAAFTASLIPTWADVKDLQNELFSTDAEVAWRIMRYNRQKDHTGTSPKESSAKYQELLQYYQDVSDNDETLHATPQLALDALNALTIPTE